MKTLILFDKDFLDSDYSVYKTKKINIMTPCFIVRITDDGELVYLKNRFGYIKDTLEDMRNDDNESYLKIEKIRNRIIRDKKLETL